MQNHFALRWKSQNPRNLSILTALIPLHKNARFRPLCQKISNLSHSATPASNQTITVSFSENANHAETFRKRGERARQHGAL